MVLENGQRFTGDLLVGADGIRSKVFKISLILFPSIIANWVDYKDRVTCSYVTLRLWSMLKNMSLYCAVRLCWSIRLGLEDLKHWCFIVGTD